MSQKILFIDRDGTLIQEPPITLQVDRLEQLIFLPGVIRNLYKITQELDYKLIMVTNQDGLGTASYPQENFDTVQSKMIELLRNEGIVFDAIHIDTSFEQENKPTRKPATGMLSGYLSKEYDLQHSYVIGDRNTDVLLAENLGAQSIFIRNRKVPAISGSLALIADAWDDIYLFLKRKNRLVNYTRTTSETNISIQLNPDGEGRYKITTGLHFFDHMLEQLAKHSAIDLEIRADGDLQIDEHHTIEDTAIALGEALALALGNKKGIERYGFSLPMDDCLAQVTLDLGGRNWIEWQAVFNREKIGDMPAEMFFHFFKSFSDAAKCNLNIKAEGINEHHKIEAIFKALGRCLKQAVKINDAVNTIPSTKGVL